MSSLISNIIHGIYHKADEEPIVTTADEFMPQWGNKKKIAKKEMPKQSPESIGDFLRSFAKTHNARIDRNNALKNHKPKLPTK